MRVIRAKSAGFCLGVSLALKRLDQELTAFRREGNTASDDDPRAETRHRGRLITFGPIIHNPLVMRHYASLGVLCEDDPSGMGRGDRVVIRAHGIPRAVEQQLRESGASLVDATCPKVKKAQLAIARVHGKGGTLLLFGERDHPEVRGLLSYAGEEARVFGDMEELESLELDEGTAYFLAAQTTQERALFHQAAQYLRERLGRDIKTLDTICDATRDRQQEVIDLCGRVRAMVVVGGLNSGNTRRLAEVARARGVPAIHVEQASDVTGEMRKTLLNGAAVIGLTAGASTPQWHIDEMQRFLEEL